MFDALYPVAARRAVFAFAVVLFCLPAFAATDLASQLPGKAQLAGVDIEIWPEYDQPAALVFIKGEIAPGADRSITLRIPATSDGPSAVAQSAAAGGNLLNLPYEKIAGKDYITLRMQVPERFFHIEFYDKLDTRNKQREYRYTWPGDIDAARLTVHVQQPANAAAFAITPAFRTSSTGSDTLLYWSKDMGAAPAGKALPVSVRYTKSDARTSKQLIGISEPAPAGTPPVPALNPEAVKPVETALPGVEGAHDDWVPALFLGALAIAAAVIFWYNWRREGKQAGAPRAAQFCSKCGNALRAGDRYCSKCGKAVA